MSFDWKRHDVCVTEEAGGFLAGRPYRDGNTVSWFDLNPRNRTFDIGRIVEDEPDLFEFEDTRGKRHTLRPLTTADWNKQKGVKKFTTDDALHEFVRGFLRRGY